MSASTEQSVKRDPALERRGAAPVLTQLSVSGMTCGNCARHVTNAIRTVPGVDSATVTLEAGRASVRWVAGARPDVSALIRSIEAQGYGAALAAAEGAPRSHGGHSLSGWNINLWIGVLGTVPLMAGEWFFGLGMTPGFRWLSFALASCVQVFAGAQFYRGAWNKLKTGSSNMDTLVALGSSTAFAYSVWALLGGHGHLYFMEAAAIITLISAGHWLESRMSARASGALRDLLQLAPQTARRIRPPAPGPAKSNWAPLPFPGRLPEISRPGQIPDWSSLKAEEVPVAELNPGDLVMLRPGDRVPTDGKVATGMSTVDESMLTGESVPVDKSGESRLYAGTTNINGSLTMRVTATGSETALSRIIAAVERAQSSRANIERLGDRVSSFFVPVVVLVAIAAGLWWGLAPANAQHVSQWLSRYLWAVHPPEGALAAALLTAAAVLIVACPCAMGLATPAAIMAGSNAAARRGILIRDGIALEKAGTIAGVVFDKTGTLTLGKPTAVEAHFPGSENGNGAPLVSPGSSGAGGGTPVSSSSPGAGASHASSSDTGALRELAAALARRSSHPISQAIARSAAGGAELRNWQECRGDGVQSEWLAESGAWKTARLGSLKWLRESGVSFSAGERFIAESSAQGATIVGLAVDGLASGLFAVTDPVKPASARVVRELQRQGLRVYLVTGDNALTAANIARQVGIPPDCVRAEARPEQKAEFVKTLQGQGQRVAFVGDGINDAPALELADLGIAVSQASDIAREAADIILLNSEIEAVPESLGLARATLRTIKQNLFWAFFYNAIGVPLAALGFLSPILCAAAMGFSDAIVIGNALRLRNWKMKRP